MATSRQFQTGGSSRQQQLNLLGAISAHVIFVSSIVTFATRMVFGVDRTAIQCLRDAGCPLRQLLEGIAVEVQQHSFFGWQSGPCRAYRVAI